MLRRFRHEGERRSWSIEVVGARVTIEMHDDSDEPVVRVRNEKTHERAHAEAAAMIAEQLRDGFVELDAAPVTNGPSYFGPLRDRWRADAPELDCEGWYRRLAESPLFARFAVEFEALASDASLPHPRARERQTWLRMQAASMPEPYLLALRGTVPHAFALAALEAARHPDLERALVSVIVAPPPPSYPGHVPTPAHSRTVDRQTFGADSIARLVGVLSATGSSAGAATNAALVLSKYPYLARPEVLSALAQWLVRSDAHAMPLARVVLERAVPELGMALDRDPRRAPTHAELLRLLDRALART